MSDIDLPHDPEGGMFGLRRAFESGPPPKPPADHSRLVAALVSAKLRKRTKRGAPPKAWRSEMRPIVAFVLQHFPDASNAEIARALYSPDGANLGCAENLESTRTIENWLTTVRKLIA